MKLPYFLFKRLVCRYPNSRPHRHIPIEKINLADIMNARTPRCVWFGHSTVFIQINGKTILCDPVFYNLFWLFSIFTGRRFTEELPLSIKEFPQIDILLLSHDHYDHMDYRSIKDIQYHVQKFCVPRGVGARLRKWGIKKQKIVELSYGNTFSEFGINFTCTPNQHFSGRSLFDRNKTLWCSWVIDSGKIKIFFSGDGAYGSHFKEIGSQYGPFDLVFMECGQEHEFSMNVHMVPEKAVQANIDLRGKIMLPIHWGIFSQSNTDWTQQIERLLKQAQLMSVKVTTPKIGELVTIGSNNYPQTLWWNL